jgi:hypothetical protein
VSPRPLGSARLLLGLPVIRGQLPPLGLLAPKDLLDLFDVRCEGCGGLALVADAGEIRLVDHGEVSEGVAVELCVALECEEAAIGGESG